MKIIKAPQSGESIELDYALVERFLTGFLHDEIKRIRGFDKAVVALSGGVDSAVVAALAARAFGPENTIAVRMPYRTSSPSSLSDAQAVADGLGIVLETVDISPMVDGLADLTPSMTPRRKGNVMARARMIVLFDKGEEHRAMPLGTGNKTERLFGYYTWHDAGDAAPINPLGDLLKTQVWGLARQLRLPQAVIDKAPSADLEADQTDETDLGITYRKADVILHHYLKDYPDSYIESLGFTPEEIKRVKDRVNSTHWKRSLPTNAMVSGTAIGEFYLRPVDFRL
ncbi:MAG TPA: NAD(+) synthase [Deinococcales bacterium]|nr:NAD(+) synthase [Deinococcales bacterium]